MKKTSKLISIFISLLLAFAVLPLTACKDDGEVKETKIMNVSLNPKVEFILDKDDKVVTVNALNEEGNLIISAEAFLNVEGMTAEDAAELFVKVTKETGFIVGGSLGEEGLEISISGDAENAQKLYDSVKGEVETYLSSVNVTIDVTKVNAYTEAELEAIVSDVCLYLDAEEVASLDYQGLIKELEKSRKETKELYSQELKNSYYAMKSVIMQKAELNAIKENAGALVSVAITAVEDVYDTGVNALTSARQVLIAEDGEYQLALADLRAKKVEYLNYRKELVESGVTITVNEQNVLDGLETALETAETALINVGNSVSASITSLEQSLKTAFDNIISTLESLSVDVSSYLDEISTAQTTALNDFATQFETSYASVISKAETDWANMYNSLIQ